MDITWSMRTGKRHLIDFRGSKYALVPFYIVDEYELKDSSAVEYDRSDPNVLIVKIRKPEASHE